MSHPMWYNYIMKMKNEPTKMKLALTFNERIAIMEGLIQAKVRIESEVKRLDGPASDWNRESLEKLEFAMDAWNKAERIGEFV